MMDSDGLKVSAGDVIRFSFGIPPRIAESVIFEKDNTLWHRVSTKNVTPKETSLRTLKDNVGVFYLVNNEVSKLLVRSLAAQEGE